MTVRTLSVALVDLDMDPVADCRVVIKSVESSAYSDSFVIQTVNESATTDVNGECSFSLTPSRNGGMYQAKVYNASGSKVIDGQFQMPDEDSDLAELLDLTVRDPDDSRAPVRLESLRIRKLAANVTAHTLDADDNNYDVIRFNNAGACTLTVPAQTELKIRAGRVWNARNRGGGGLSYALSTAADDNGDAIEGSGTSAAGTSGNKLSSIYLEDKTDDVNRWVTVGDLS